MNKSAIFDATRVYRYVLVRDWSSELFGSCLSLTRTLCVIGLNPSTADETKDDPTIRRCIDFARRLHCTWLSMLNLFAYRATDPKVLSRLTRDQAVGPDTDLYLKEEVGRATHVVAAWGNNGDLFGRAKEVLTLLQPRQVECFGWTKDGSPKHPLYLPRTTRLVPLEARP